MIIQIIQLEVKMAKIFSSKRDVYIEIADRYEKYITLGVIKSGEKLPSVRVTAGELGVNPNTVQRAYSLLEERGFIRSMPKKGAYVIYDKEKGRADESQIELTLSLARLKELGFSKSDVLSTLEEVYKND